MVFAIFIVHFFTSFKKHLFLPYFKGYLKILENFGKKVKFICLKFV